MRKGEKGRGREGIEAAVIGIEEEEEEGREMGFRKAEAEAATAAVAAAAAAIRGRREGGRWQGPSSELTRI